MPSPDRLIIAAGALALAVGTAASAAAAHFPVEQDAARLASAAQMLLIHGLGLLLLAIAGAVWPSMRRPLGWIAGLLFTGLLLFAGSLLLAVAFRTPTALAPLGGGLIILCWLLVAGLALLRSPLRTRE